MKELFVKLIKIGIIAILSISIYQLFTIEGTATNPNGYKYTYKGGIVKICTGTEEAYKDLNV